MQPSWQSIPAAPGNSMKIRLRCCICCLNWRHTYLATWTHNPVLLFEPDCQWMMQISKFSSLRDMGHNFSSYHPALSLTTGSLAEVKRPEIWAAVSKNSRIKDVPRSYLKAANPHTPCWGKQGSQWTLFLRNLLLFPHTVQLGSQHKHSRPRDRTG